MRLRIQTMKELKAEMISAARGERKAPAGAARASFESVEALMRLLTPENRRLLAAIEKKKPASVADLARMVGRAEPNVSRTLGKLVAAGLVRLKSGAGRTKVPEVAIRRLMVDIDICHQTDRVAVA